MARNCARKGHVVLREQRVQRLPCGREVGCSFKEQKAGQGVWKVAGEGECDGADTGEGSRDSI